VGKVKWVKLKETTVTPPVLIWDTLVEGFKNFFTRAHDGKTRIENYRCALNARWFGERDFHAYREMLEKAGEKRLLQWAREYRKLKTKLLKFAKKISKTNFDTVSNSTLEKIFLEYVNLASRAYNYCYDYFLLNQFYPEQVNSIVLKHAGSNAANWIDCVTGLSKPTDLLVEQKQLGEIALQAKKEGFTKKLLKKCVKHAERFGYLNMFTYKGTPFTPEDVKQRVEKLVEKSVREIKAETIDKFNAVRERNKKTREFVKKFRLTRSEAKKIAVLKEYVFTSLWADELYHKIPWLVKPMLIELSKRIGTDYDSLVNMTINEIVTALKHGGSKKVLRKAGERKKEYALIYSNGKTIVLSGKALKQYLAPELRKEAKLKALRELHGQTAFPGKVVGTVKVIRGMDDVRNFANGLILVASSTAPMHVPAMEKALAIVTDEGGLLSHAAIVSREFKKPCVVGTKNATKILKDGDLVEVDAGKGIVKKAREASAGSVKKIV